MEATRAEISQEKLDELDAQQEFEFFEEIGYTGDPDPESPDVEEETAVRLDYLLERRREIERQIESNNEVARRRISMIQSWRDEENAVLGRQVEWLDRKVRELAPVLRLGEDGNKKSKRLPNGEVGFRKQRDTVDIVDQGLAVSFAEAHDIPVKIKKSVNKTPLIEWVQSTGKEPTPERDGFTWIKGTDEFYIRTEE